MSKKTKKTKITIKTTDDIIDNLKLEKIKRMLSEGKTEKEIKEYFYNFYDMLTDK